MISLLNGVRLFSKNPKLNNKATMMGYGNKNLYHKYVYNKMKHFLLNI